MSQTPVEPNPGDENNPLIHPEKNPPGSQNMEPSELHQNAVHQDYNLAGGKREKGDADYEPTYPKVTNPTGPAAN